ERLFWRRQLVRQPIGHDVAVGLVRYRDLDQLNSTGAPLTLRFHPDARAQLVACFEVFVLMEVPVALHQAKARWIGQCERADLQPLRIDERAPNPLTSAGNYRQAVGVVHLWPIVIADRMLILSEKKHRGEGR